MRDLSDMEGWDIIQLEMRTKSAINLAIACAEKNLHIRKGEIGNEYLMQCIALLKWAQILDRASFSKRFASGFGTEEDMKAADQYVNDYLKSQTLAKTKALIEVLGENDETN